MQDEPFDPKVVFPIVVLDEPSDPNVVLPIELYEVLGFIGKVCAVSACPKLSNNEIKIVRFNIDESPSKVMKLP